MESKHYNFNERVRFKAYAAAGALAYITLVRCDNFPKSETIGEELTKWGVSGIASLMSPFFYLFVGTGMGIGKLDADSKRMGRKMEEEKLKLNHLERETLDYISTLDSSIYQEFNQK